MTDDFDDELNRHLASLDSDLDRTVLPGASAARRRAAQRTRHQVTGGLLAGVAVVAVGALTVIQPTFTSAPAPAHSPSGTESVTVAPTTPTDAPSDHPSPNPSGDPTGDPTGDATGDDTPAVPESALLTVKDLAGDTGVIWQPVSAPEEPLDCAPAVPEGAAEVHLASDMGGRFDEFVEVTDSAEQRFTNATAQVEECVELAGQNDDSYHVDQIWTVDGIGDEAWTARYTIPGTEPDAVHLVGVQIMRTGDHVAVLTESWYAQDVNHVPDIDRLVLGGGRLCEAVGTTCISEPAHGERLRPAPVGEVAGWLTVDEVVTATGLAQIAEGSEIAGHDGGWNHIGLPIDPATDGASSLQLRTYYDPFEPGGLVLDEMIARFDDADAARAHYDNLVAAADAFQQDGDVLTNTGTVSGDGFESTSWRLENAEYQSIFVYGVVVRGDAVAVVTHSPEDPMSADRMNALMRAAGTHLGEL